MSACMAEMEVQLLVSPAARLTPSTDKSAERRCTVGHFIEVGMMQQQKAMRTFACKDEKENHVYRRVDSRVYRRGADPLNDSCGIHVWGILACLPQLWRSRHDPVTALSAKPLGLALVAATGPHTAVNFLPRNLQMGSQYRTPQDSMVDHVSQRPPSGFIARKPSRQLFKHSSTMFTI